MEQQVPEIERAKRLIRKLMDRTADRGCTEAEAMESSEKVGALLKQFDLELSDVFIAEEVCVKRELMAANEHFSGVIGGISRLCSLKYYHDLGQPGAVFVVFGFERDMELALYLYEVILEAFGTEWAKYTVIHGFKRKTREAFEMGFGARVRERLVQIRAERDAEAAARAKASNSKDLVVVRDHIVEEEFEKTGVRLIYGRSRPIHDRHAFRSGAEAGNRVQINTPLNGETQSMLD